MKQTAKSAQTDLLSIAARVRELREIANLTTAETAEKTGFSEEEYVRFESGTVDLPYSFIRNCAEFFGVEMAELVEGESTARLTGFTVTRRGEGRVTATEPGVEIREIAPLFRDKLATPHWVTYKFDPALQSAPIELHSHDGHEFDLVLEGQLKVQIGGHSVVLGAGDSIYYNSSFPHGEIAVGGADCVFCAVLISGENAEPISARGETITPLAKNEPLIFNNFIDVEEDESGGPLAIRFKNTARYNFAFDVVDVLADKSPDKLAMLHIDRDRNERRFTFEDMSRLSARAANYLVSLGVKKGDHVMLVLKRNWQFWVNVLALHRIGAIMIPAPDQLLEKDFDYRFKAGSVSAIITTSQSNAYLEAEKAMAYCTDVRLRVMCNGAVDGWHDFDTEYQTYRSRFPRTDDTPGGDDPMLMFFSSGTTGYPKLVTHSHTYGLGHFATAYYWHRVDPNGIHFTISDTGWGKALWGKLYGQWLCEGAIFTYDFDRFDANDVLPLFKKHNITTFCAPPTIYRFLIREDLSKFDLSSIRHATTAGEALNPEVFYKFKEATGLSIYEGFGQTESTILIGNFVGMTPKIGSMGKANPAYTLDVIDPEGNPVASGETGEIVVRVDNGKPAGLFLGYYLEDKKTSDAWKFGVYHTGDTAWRDEEGYFWYVGRVDDVIKSSGYRIGPFEIESVIMELPYVLECGVSSAPDEVRGQVVKASIVLTKNSGREPNDELAKEIQNYVKTHTAPYKYPRIVVFRDELPKTINGKIQRNRL
ncbi:MAG: AMP-binding protein [Oscillospiraceae bacterium]|jgi:acetyl-CoA synthetase|nr:AMP-binding protein [Oscillospiraceae bacterium]